MRSISHLPGIWSMTSFDYGKSLKTGIVPLSTYQIKSCKRASSCSIPRTSHRWRHFNGFGNRLNKNVDYLLSQFTLFAVQLLKNFNDEKQRPRSKIQQLLCFTIWSMMLWDVSFSLGAVQSESHFGSGVTKLVLLYQIPGDTQQVGFPFQMLFGAVWLPPICLFSAVDIP